MPLVRLLAINSISKNGGEIVLQDTTGAYNALNNLTGYGAPNAIVASATFLYTTLIRYDNEFAAIGLKTIIQPSILNQTTYILTMADLGGVATTMLPDGVLKVTTYLLMAAVAATKTSPKVIEGANLASLLLGDSIAVMGTDGIPVFVAIDTTKPNTATKIYTVTDICINGFTQVYPAYSSSALVLNLAAGEAALVAEIGKYAEAGGCSDKDSELMLFYREKVAAEIKFSCKNYSAANLLATSLYTRVKLSCS